MAKAKPNKNDVRYLATQERIEETFWDLLADGGFPKITVRALSECAGINRGTFYLHAEDKYDLLSQVEDRMHQGMMGGGARLTSSDAPEGEAPPMAAPMIAGARFAYENRERMLLLMDDSCDPLFFSKYAAKVKAAMLGADDDLTSGQRYALALMEGVIGSLFGEWVRGGMRETPEEYVGIVLDLAAKLDLTSISDVLPQGQQAKKPCSASHMGD